MDDLDETAEKNYSAAEIIGSVTKPLHEQQADLLFEVRRWCGVKCRDVVEFFLNFDTDTATQFEGPNRIDLMHGTKWKLYIFGSLIDGAVHPVDLANYNQRALHQIHRSAAVNCLGTK